jgi:hypothetical protein
MLVETVKSPQPARPRPIDRQSKLVSAAAPIASFNPHNDDDPDPPPRAPAMQAWPRVFPGL